MNGFASILDRSDQRITITQDKGLVYGKVLVDDYPVYVVRWLEWRPRGLVIMPANPSNVRFTHPNVIRYDSTNIDEVKAAIKAAKRREKGEKLKW